MTLTELLITKAFIWTNAENSIYRALISDVEILLLDESTANLDDKSRDLIFNILQNKEITIINSTHDSDQFKKLITISILI